LAQVLARSDSREVSVDDHDTILALEASNKRGVVEKSLQGFKSKMALLSRFARPDQRKQALKPAL
jgi:hypothetical protein